MELASAMLRSQSAGQSPVDSREVGGETPRLFMYSLKSNAHRIGRDQRADWGRMLETANHIGMVSPGRGFGN